MPCKEAVVYFIFKGHPRESPWNTMVRLQFFFASPGNPKGSFHQHSEGGRQKSLQRRFVKAFTLGVDCLITLALRSCWSFPKKGVEEWHWDGIFVPEAMRLACIF